MQLAALVTENSIEQSSTQILQRTASRISAQGGCGFISLSQPCLSTILKLIIQTVTLQRMLVDGLPKEELSIV